MRKNLGVKPYLLPMPVLVIGTYNDDGSANAMNAAYGSMLEENSVSIYIANERKTTENILRTKAFTVNLADINHLIDADYVGLVSGNDDKNKIKKTAFEIIKSEFVDAPIISTPISFECKLIDYQKADGRLIGEIVNVSVDEKFIDNDGKISVEPMNLITFNPIENTYNILGEVVGDAFSSKEIIESQEFEGDFEGPDKKYLEKNIDERIARIQKMEKIMNELSGLQEKLNSVLDEFEEYQKYSDEFDDYYSSKNWMDDYDADNLGLIPEDIDRGVITEDLPYDVLGENYNLGKRMKKLSRKLLKGRD